MRPIVIQLSAKHNKQNGVALITVLLIVALASILVTQMSAKLQLQLQRVTNIELNQQAYWFAMGAEAFAKRVLIMSFDGQENVTHLGQIWAQGENTYPIDYGQITGEITDLQSCFNLNALRKDNSVTNSTNQTGSPKTGTPSKSTSSHTMATTALEKLIIELNIENVSAFEAKDMVDALTDWLDSDGFVSNNGGAEDNDYSSKEYPYLPANHYLASFNELRTVEHFTLPIIDALRSYVCVIPNTNLHKINVNTLDADNIEILMAVLDIPKAVAEELISSREDEGYEKIDDLFSLPVLTKYKLTQDQKDQLVVDSEYFTVKTKTSFNNSYFFLSSIMKIENNNQVSVISRTIGRD
jgi:general secretion pathway protein K